MRVAAAREEANADRHDLCARSGAGRVAEQPTTGRDAGDVRAVSAGDDAEADEACGIHLRDERNGLADRGSRVVVTVLTDLERVLVCGHRGFIRERQVVV